MAQAWRDWVVDMQAGLVRIGLHLELEATSKACDGFFAGSLPPSPGLTVYETRIQQWALRLGGFPTDAWCRELATHSLVRWQAQITLDPNALPTLRKLKAQGIRIGVLSNFDHEPHVLQLLREAGVLQELDALVISGAVGLKKPDPAIFSLALQKVGTEPSKTLFVGDHPEQDFEGAHLAGLIAVLLQRGSTGVDRLQMNYYADLAQGLDQGAEKNAHRVISDLTDVLQLI